MIDLNLSLLCWLTCGDSSLLYSDLSVFMLSLSLNFFQIYKFTKYTMNDYFAHLPLFHTVDSCAVNGPHLSSGIASLNIMWSLYFETTVIFIWPVTSTKII